MSKTDKHPALQGRDNLINYISKSVDNLTENRSYLVYAGLPIYINDPLPEFVNIGNVLNQLVDIVPFEMLNSVDMFLIGQFDELKARDLDSMWKDRAIYLTNEQKSESDMLDDIIHEVAHALEDQYGLEIYADGKIESEFLLKRRHMHDILMAHGYEVDLTTLLNPVYNKELDEFLYKTIGYEKLNHLLSGLFVSAYGATSLREYWANAFEEYFMPDGNRTSIRTISPELYNKIEYLTEIEHEERTY